MHPSSDQNELFVQRTACRFDGSPLESLVDLGEQALTGLFPKPADPTVPVSPLELAWSPTSGLVQLAHDYPGEMMYGETYGYRSGLNASMVAHLERKISILESQFCVQSGDTVLDIGANDATTLKAYCTPGLKRLGIDPSAEKFRSFYTEDISLEVDFFTADAYRRLSDTPAKIITSIAMFYDLPDPVAFAKDIASVLASDGIWHFEQSYLPIMLAKTSYDTICQEHLEYYSLDVVRQILDAADLQILDVTTNDINGGSFAVTAGHKRTTYPVSNLETVDWMLAQEERLGLRTRAPYEAFAGRMSEQRDQLLGLLKALKDSGKRVLGLGASTKGNVILQYCGIGTDLIDAISDVNPDKWGAMTPGTHIPIISETDAAAMNPDYYLVLPWHFRANLITREADFLSKGGKLIFPLPSVEIVGA